MVSINKRLIKLSLINEHYIHKVPIDVKKIPNFNQKPHYNIISLLTHVLILMDMYPVNITNLSSKYPIRRSVVIRHGTKRKDSEKEKMVSKLITRIVAPLERRGVVTEKRTRSTYRYSLVNKETGKSVHLFWTHYIEDTIINPTQKIKIARRLAILLGIRRVACINSSRGVDIDNTAYYKNYAPYCYIKRKYPSPISRKFIYANLIRLLEGVSNNPTLSDKIL